MSHQPHPFDEQTHGRQCRHEPQQGFAGNPGDQRHHADQQAAQGETGAQEAAAGLPVIPEGPRRNPVELVHVIAAKGHARQGHAGQELLQPEGPGAVEQIEEGIAHQTGEEERHPGDLPTHRRQPQVVEAAVETMRLAQVHVELEQTEGHERHHHPQGRQPGRRLMKGFQRRHIQPAAQHQQREGAHHRLHAQSEGDMGVLMGAEQLLPVPLTLVALFGIQLRLVMFFVLSPVILHRRSVHPHHLPLDRLHLLEADVGMGDVGARKAGDLGLRLHPPLGNVLNHPEVQRLA